MNQAEADRAFDALLAEALAPGGREPDRGFVRRVDAAVALAERYRLWRAAILRQLASELLAVGALAGSAAVVAQIPDLRAALASAPMLGWPALFSLLLFWLLVTRTRTRTRAAFPV